jgi:hypothetical protein
MYADDLRDSKSEPTHSWRFDCAAAHDSDMLGACQQRFVGMALSLQLSYLPLALLLSPVLCSDVFCQLGVKLLGELPLGMPPPRFPSASSTVIWEIVGSAGVVALLCYIESIAIAKRYAAKRNYNIDGNQVRSSLTSHSSRLLFLSL